MLDGVPGQFIASGRGRSAREKSLERINAPGGADPLVINRSTDGGDVHTDPVGNLLHLQGFEKFVTKINEFLLVIDNLLSHFDQRPTPLFNGFDQPSGCLKLALEIVAGLVVYALGTCQFCVGSRNTELGQGIVYQTDLIATIGLVFEIKVRDDIIISRDLKLRSRTWIEPADMLDGFFLYFPS